VTPKGKLVVALLLLGAALLCFQRDHGTDAPRPRPVADGTPWPPPPAEPTPSPTPDDGLDVVGGFMP